MTLPTIDEVKARLSYRENTGEFVCVRTGEVRGGRHSKGYVVVSVMGRTIYAHRLAWLMVTGEWPAHQIDHINGDPQDNRFSNLRLATASENQSNIGVKKHNQIGVKGVTKVGLRFRAEIRKNKRRHHIGYFSTIEEAADAYAAAAKRIHGEFANAGHRSQLGCE